MRVDPRVRLSANHLIALVTGLLVFVPIYLVFVNSLKTRAESSSMGVGLPAIPQWENYATVIEDGDLVVAFFNSLLYSLAATAICVVLASMAAYVLARRRTRRHRLIYLLLIMGIALPTNFVTLMQVMQWTGLVNTQIGIILLYAAMQIPFSVFLVYAFIGSIPRELDEAAFIDGCGPLRAFFRVIFPLLLPVLVTLAVLSVLNIWNEFLMPLYFLNSSGDWPMTLAVYNFFGMYQSNWGLVSADVVLTIVPVILVYLLAQRWVLSGMSTGAVKG
jgi:raffinose/stachyose/melibiose transport system permease protein